MTCDLERRTLSRVITAFALLLGPLPALSFTVDTTYAASANVTGLWWVPSESGWGATLTQQGAVVFVAIYTYDSANNPLWYVASHCEISADRCNDTLYRVRGGAPLTSPFNSTNVAASNVGTVALVFTDLNNASMTLLINGVTATKQITRQLWGAPAAPVAGNLPGAVYSDVFQASEQVQAAGGWRNRGVNIRNTASTSIGCVYRDPPPDRVTLESLVGRAGGRVTVSTPTEWCAQIGGDSLCLKLFAGLVLLSEETTAGISYTDIFAPGLVANSYTSIQYITDERYARVRSESRDLSVAIGASNCNAAGQPSQAKEVINGNWTGYSFSYSPNSRLASLAPSTMTCSAQTCTIPGPSGATFALSSTQLWRTAAGAPRLAGAAVSTDQSLASAFLCIAATVDETRPFENCIFFTFKRS
jgi:hypothetical protein